MKLCKDCKHCSYSDFQPASHSTCYAPAYTNFINGKPLKLRCDDARRNKLELYCEWDYQPCGPDAQYFEAKNES